MAAASSKQQFVKPSGAGETQKTETTVSAADLALLRSLTAKIKELTEAELARAPMPVPGAADSTLVSAPPTAVAPRIASGGASPASGTSSADPMARPDASPGASPTAARPLLDSTQTVRALTPTELTDSEASRWFAIELMLSAEQIDAAEVPNLDIFDAYRLYSVTGPDQGRIIHALRLGFFSSETAAQSVARYLEAYFPTPTIRRVSIAEHERFAERLVTAGKDIGVSGMHAVIELAETPTPRPQAPRSQAPRSQAHRAKASSAGSKPPRGIAGLLWARSTKSPGGTDQ